MAGWSDKTSQKLPSFQRFHQTTTATLAWPSTVFVKSWCTVDYHIRCHIAIRRKFWSTQVRTTVRQILLNCRRCRRVKGAHAECPRWLHTHPKKYKSPHPLKIQASTVLNPFDRGRGEGLTIYLPSIPKNPLRPHQWHICWAIPFVPKNIYRQTLQAETDYIWQCFTVQVSKVHCWWRVGIYHH